MQNVIHIMSGFGGGISSFIKNKAIALKESDIIFDVITFDECDSGFVHAIEETGGQIFKVSNPKKEGFHHFFRQLNRIFKDMPEDTLIHCHVQGYRALPFYLAAKKNHIERFAIHAHTGLSEEKMRATSIKITRKINRFMATEYLSCGRKASIASFGENLFTQNTIMHIPNSLDESTYFNESLLQKSKKQLKQEIFGKEVAEKKIIGHVGRFHVVKNHLFMLDMVERMKTQKDDFVFVFVGDGEIKVDIEKEVTNRQLDPYVIFLGRRDDLPYLYKAFDIFLLPSFYEGLPTVAIEAQATATETLLSDTITEETDLGLGLVSFLSLNEPDEWIDKIDSVKEKELSSEEIRQVIKTKGFTNKESARLYKQFITRELTNHVI